MRGEQAVASTVLSTMVAGSLFVGVLGLAFATDWTPDAEPTAREDAQALGSVLLGSPGRVRDGEGGEAGKAWSGDAAGADALDRLGLRDADGGGLSHEAFDNLRRAPAAAVADDGRVSYEEARASLGLDDAGLDFHVRTLPLLPPLEEVLAGAREPHLRVTYVGDYGRAPAPVAPSEGLGVGAVTCAASPVAADAWRLSVPLRNGGTVATQFQVRFVVDFDGAGAHVVRRVANSPLVAAGAEADVHIDVAARPGRTCSDATRVTLQVADVASHLLDVPGRSVQTGAVPAVAPLDLWLDTGRVHADPLQTLRIEYGGDLVAGDTLTLSFHPGANASLPAVAQVHRLVAAGDEPAFTLPAGTLPVGEYALRLAASSGVRAAERMLVVPAPVAPYTPTGAAPTILPGPAAVHETAALDALVEHFCPFRAGHVPESPLPTPPDPAVRCAPDAAGDVLPDTRDALDLGLPGRLLAPDGTPRFDAVSVLVVGSDVDHAAFAGGAVRAAVRDWVLAGGTLVVLGSAQASPDWLRPLLDRGEPSSSGGLATPDEAHPLLRVPEPVRADYPARASWDLRGQPFTQVRQQDDRALLAVNDAGAHGAGNIVLTGWTPYDLGAGPGAAPHETMQVLQNLLATAHRSLFLDYGPPLSDPTAAPAASLESLHHPVLGPVTLTVLVYVFPR